MEADYIEIRVPQETYVDIKPKKEQPNVHVEIPHWNEPLQSKPVQQPLRESSWEEITRNSMKKQPKEKKEINFTINLRQLIMQSIGLIVGFTIGYMIGVN